MMTKKQQRVRSIGLKLSKVLDRELPKGESEADIAIISVATLLSSVLGYMNPELEQKVSKHSLISSVGGLVIEGFLLLGDDDNEA